MEGPEERARREHRRLLFDSVADLYAESRQGYPEEIVRAMVETAGLESGAAVLEIGCGTGQLSGQLARLPVRLTAIDIGPAMVEAARRHLAGLEVQLEACALEEFQAEPASFGLIVSATAFHWIDPDVAWAKAARLLVPGGWLAILYVGETYDNPFGSAVQAAWVARSRDGGAWLTQKAPTVAEMIASTGLLEAPVERSHAERMVLMPDTVLGVERTRATYLGYDPPTQASFTAELEAALAGAGRVPATIETTLTRGRVRSNVRAGPGRPAQAPRRIRP